MEKMKCSVCGRLITDKTRAWLPHRQVVEAKLGREVKLADLPAFVLCPAHGLELRAMKEKLPKEFAFKANTYRFDLVERNMFEAMKEEEERLARRRACTAKIGDLVGVNMVEDEDGTVLIVGPPVPVAPVVPHPTAKVGKEKKAAEKKARKSLAEKKAAEA